jgi:hypothetical protein
MPIYKKGEQFTNLNDLAYWMRELGCWVYWRDKPIHPSFIESMPLRTIILALHDGVLFHAIRRD